MPSAVAGGRDETVDAVVVGAGFAGLYMLYRLRELGLSTRVIEAGGDVGGTWYWNRYPGARCDASSLLYSYSFSRDLEQEWSWSEKYATQAEILRYIQHVAERFDLRKHIWFDTRVSAARRSDNDNTWEISTERDDRVTARFVIMASGCLSVGRIPDIDGLAETKLPVYHTGNWPREGVDFSGKRVGVIGTGSSGIQAIPEIGKQAAQLVVFQRTANFSVPARNAPMDADIEASVKRQYPELRKKWRTAQLLGAGEELKPGSSFVSKISALEVSEQERRREYEHRWQQGGAFFVGAFYDLITNEIANATAADFVRGKIREIVKESATAAALTPIDYPFGTKRICVDTNYYETFNQPHVSLVDLRVTPISHVAEGGVVTTERAFALDALVFATGFDAMTGALLGMDIRGVDGLLLRDKWADGTCAYLGLMIAGFPNLFTVTGPGSPSVLGNVVACIEQHVELIGDIITKMQSEGHTHIEAEPQAEVQWVERVNAYANATLYPRANSWYLGANIPGKPRVFMPFVGGLGLYRELCDKLVADGYAGFTIT